MVDEPSRREARRLVDEAGLLPPVIEALLKGDAVDGPGLAGALLGGLARLCDADVVVCYRVSTGDGEAVPVQAYGFESKPQTRALPIGRGILGHSIAAAETIAAARIHQDGRFDREVDVLSDAGVSALVSVPIRLGGTVDGCLVAQRGREGRSPDAFSDVQIAVLEDVAPFVGFAVRYLGDASQRADEATRRLCRARLSGLPEIDDDELLAADEDLVRSFDRPLLTHCRLLPLSRSDAGLRVAVASPNDLVTLEDFRLATGEDVAEVFLVSSSGLRRALRHFFEGDTPLPEPATAAAPAAAIGPEVSSPVSESEDDAIERLAYTVLQEAARPGVLELHIVPGPVGARLLARTECGLEERWRYPLRQNRALAQRIDHLAAEGGGTLPVSKGTRGVISRAATHHGPALVIQVRAGWGAVSSLERTGLGADGAAELRRWFSSSGHIILLAGRRRTGRLAAALSILGEARAGGANCVVAHHRGPAGIAGAMDVILPESLAPEDAGRAWARALGVSPDILITGDLRDTMAVAAVAEVASSGALVVATMNAATIQDAVDRLVCLGLDRGALDRLVRGIVLFVTAPRLCPECRMEADPGSEGLASCGITAAWSAPGCETCAHRGTLGLVRLHQLADWPSAAASAAHLDRFRDHAVRLAEEGDIAPDTALRLVQ